MLESITYLFGIKFVELSLSGIFPPKAQDFGFWTIGHVD